MTFKLFIPGSVVGMILLLILLLLKVVQPNLLETGATFLIDHLPLLFLPATVGVILYLNLFVGKGVLLLLISLLSTVLVMVSAGFMSEWLVVRKGQEK